MASDHAAVSYLLGAEALFEQEPEIMISGLAMGGPRIVAAGNDGGDAVATSMSVTVEGLAYARAARRRAA